MKINFALWLTLAYFGSADVLSDSFYDQVIDYSQHGKNWPANSCVAGTSTPTEQSPINIDMSQTLPNPYIMFEMENLNSDTVTYMEVLGNGSVIFVHY